MIDKSTNILSEDEIVNVEMVLSGENISYDQPQDDISKNGFEDRNIIGSPAKGDFRIMKIVLDTDKENNCTIYPASYSQNGSDYDEIHWYIIEGKQYHRGKFIDICHNGKVFFDKGKIKPEHGKVVEVGGLTKKGLETPTFYMVITQ